LRGEACRMVFADPPYNVKIDGHATGLGKNRHREFAMASGEMSEAQFIVFLTQTLKNVAAQCVDGAILYICMDWRHLYELLETVRATKLNIKNLCVWAKTNGGMGSFYRSQHELIFVLKVGSKPHINNFGLGDTGRYRTNVWSYAGSNSSRGGRTADLKAHPTPKPVDLVCDAILDVSNRGDLVLDCFGGSGTTLIAAEKTGRRARIMEIDPIYTDTQIKRWQNLTGKKALHAVSKKTFTQMEAERNNHDEDA
jgi:DNA modification methylase